MVELHGGEVLKFIGDGLLAVFPFDDYSSEQEAANAALRAGEAALVGLETLNADAEAFPEIAGWRPLRSGIALHRGEVFFGNVSSPRRLDFTVIGKAVNAASRVESLCKSTQRSLLVTRGVRDLSDLSFDALGKFKLNGLDEAVEVYARNIRK